MITQDELKAILEYSTETGDFKWKIPRKGSKGQHIPAGTLTNKGYKDVCINGKKYGLHRLAFLYMLGYMPTAVDHINGVKSDNRWANLRPATVRENSFNYKGGDSISKYRNVYYDPRGNKKWFVRITTSEGVKMNLGYFMTAEEANEVASEAREKHHGEYYWSGGD